MCERCQKCSSYKKCSGRPRPQAKVKTSLLLSVVSLMLWVPLTTFKVLLLMKVRKRQIEQWNMYVDYTKFLVKQRQINRQMNRELALRSIKKLKRARRSK